VTSPQEPRSLARARALRPGDRLAVLCVSGPVDPEPLAAGLGALRCAGLDPVTYPSLADPGHGGPFQTFPLGIAAELDADQATVRLLDPPLS
jgi:muramoyltetrapeptide carboxypeptidase LdcA involved in peptidoglycan recycling